MDIGSLASDAADILDWQKEVKTQRYEQLAGHNRRTTSIDEAMPGGDTEDNVGVNVTACKQIHRKGQKL